ncbi:13948_t:CDS:1, partial [Acaulospora morrowiae]
TADMIDKEVKLVLILAQFLGKTQAKKSSISLRHSNAQKGFFLSAAKEKITKNSS